MADNDDEYIPALTSSCACQAHPWSNGDSASAWRAACVYCKSAVIVRHAHAAGATEHACSTTFDAPPPKAQVCPHCRVPVCSKRCLERAWPWHRSLCSAENDPMRVFLVSVRSVRTLARAMVFCKMFTDDAPKPCIGTVTAAIGALANYSVAGYYAHTQSVLLLAQVFVAARVANQHRDELLPPPSDVEQLRAEYNCLYNYMNARELARIAHDTTTEDRSDGGGGGSFIVFDAGLIRNGALRCSGWYGPGHKGSLERFIGDDAHLRACIYFVTLASPSAADVPVPELEEPPNHAHVAKYYVEACHKARAVRHVLALVRIGYGVDASLALLQSSNLIYSLGDWMRFGTPLAEVVRAKDSPMHEPAKHSRFPALSPGTRELRRILSGSDMLLPAQFIDALKSLHSTPEERAEVYRALTGVPVGVQAFAQPLVVGVMRLNLDVYPGLVVM
jgi:hypothetical protein